MSATNDDNDKESFVTYLTAQAAYDLDQELMAPGKFTLEQLMELAGLAVAQATYVSIRDAQAQLSSSLPPRNPNHDRPRILVVCGPGNNGGDGLVAARHLTLFGCQCDLVYPKQPPPSSPSHYARLVEQCRDAGIANILQAFPSDDTYDVMVDAIFGFSFHGEPREPFKSILRDMKRAQEQHGSLLVSVDVPSGWHVNDGPVGLDDECTLQPDVLISLTAPKPCAQYFGKTTTTNASSSSSSSASSSRRPVRHFVGGRFVPPALANKYHLVLPTYPGMSQIVEIPTTIAATTTKDDKDDDYNYDWQTDYAAYLAQQEAVAAHNKDEEPVASSPPKKDEDATTPSWQEEYAAYCHAKESETDPDPSGRRQP